MPSETFEEDFDKEALRVEIEQLSGKFLIADDEEKEAVIKRSRELSAVEFGHCVTYEDWNAAFFHALHPEDRKHAYLKQIELVPTREFAQQLFYNAVDDETRAAAKKKFDSFAS